MKKNSRNPSAHHEKYTPALYLTFLQLILLIAVSNCFHLSYNFNNRAASLHHSRSRTPSINNGLRATTPSTQYQIGEKVIVIEEDDGASQHHSVGIVETKKGGWYTICLQHNSLRLKRRGSQLQKNKSDVFSDDTSKSTADTTINKSEEEDTTPSSIIEPDEVLDLDSLLLSKMSDGDGQHNHTISSNNTIQQITNCHSKVTKWVVFSDLHVMPSTLSTCLQVLDTVHQTALRQDNNAGILFLGDFWHHRGFVRVDCLNAILEKMSSWTVPCIMIPGNHDQVDWKGVEHALTPLSNAYRIASMSGSRVDTNTGDTPTTTLTTTTTGTIQQQQYYPGPLILTQPTKFLNALFIPHIRDKATMQSILSSREAASSSALFVHADVKGASMNDLIQSQHGLSASIFPSDKKIYSGHFHKPHLVQKTGKQQSLNDESITTIRYVGSPYQTSLSEAGQAKSLLILDSTNNWQCIDEIPIDVGPRYHRVSSVHRLLNLSNSKLRQGDKVTVTVCQQDIDDLKLINGGGQEESSPFDTKLEELRTVGISVEIRDGQPAPDAVAGASSTKTAQENDIEVEDLTPEATLAAYLENEVENGEQLGEATAKKLLESGVAILQELIDSTSNGTTSHSPTSNEAIVTELEIESVSMLGFGSFRQETVYPLKDRGVVLLRGTNKDFGSDSNGVGKSTLAMASLWALAGSTDPRPTQDGKVTDIVNDFSKVAQVTLRGFINSKPFIISRAKSTTSKGSGLTFSVNGLDLTRQSPKDTQVLINESFSIQSQMMLMRTIFHGQHTIGGLLEASDAKFKEEMSQLVSLELWQQSASLARSKQRKLLKKTSEVEGMISIRTKDKARAEMSVQSAKEDTDRKERSLENESQIMLQKERQLSIDTDHPGVEELMDSVQVQLHKTSDEINSLEEELSKITDYHRQETVALQSEVKQKTSAESEAKAKLQSCQRKHDMATMELKSAERQLSVLQSEWDIESKRNGVSSQSTPPETCRTCGQPIISQEAKKHVMESIELKLTAAASLVDKAKEPVSIAELSCATAKQEAVERQLELQTCISALQEAEEKLSVETDDLHNEIKEARMRQSNLSAEFASLARKAKELSKFNLVKSQMQANLNRLKEALKVSVDAYESRCFELEAIEANTVELQKEKESLFSAASHYTMLADTFGPKGIQAFVLRNIVQALQYCSQRYLDELSDGSLQLRLEVGPNDSIMKQAAVRSPDGTSWRIRPLSSLSGGQWRRCSLSLSLGFVDLAAKRGKLRSSLLVLDEPLTHLDSAGRKSVGKLLRKMLRKDHVIGSADVDGRRGFGLSTILVILQEIAAEEIEECFDQIDEVVKHGGESFVVLDENNSETP